MEVCTRFLVFCRADFPIYLAAWYGGSAFKASGRFLISHQAETALPEFCRTEVASQQSHAECHRSLK